MGDAFLQVKNISKYFRNETALDCVSFSAEKGQVIGFSGHNGCGKTVLFKCITGLLYANKGEILIGGEKVGIGDEMPRGISYTIEEPSFIWKYSGRKNLSLLYELNHRKNPEIIEHYMTLVGLPYESNKPVKGYSLGMKQRLAIAQTLMDDNEVLIFDEPMNGLDRNGVREIRKILKEEKEKGKLILLASHNPGDLEELADRVYVMENGKIIDG